MHNSVAIANQHYQDVNPRVCGWADCAPAHKYGPAVRNYWLLHYVLEGEGIFRTGEREYRVCPSQMFVIHPGELTYYEADNDVPWKYIWIGFDCHVPVPEALKGSVLTFPQGRPLFEGLRQAEELTQGRETYLCGKIWELMYLISSGQKRTGQKERYIQQARNYMESEYMVGITVNEVAVRLGLDRSYFSNLFRESMGRSPQQYLNEVRMTQAASLLMESGCSVTETAASVGYADVFAFSRTFKKYYGISPGRYRGGINC